jgi:hypothetical protein
MRDPQEDDRQMILVVVYQRVWVGGGVGSARENQKLVVLKFLRNS